jgi:hypothetical protein
MNSYHFDLGNSTDGPIGMCARITAKDEVTALNILRNCLEDNLQYGDVIEIKLSHGQREAGVEYVCVYISPDNINVTDINESETEEVDDAG